MWTFFMALHFISSSNLIVFLAPICTSANLFICPRRVVGIDASAVDRI